MSQIQLKLLDKSNVTQEYVAWHNAPHTVYFNENQRRYDTKHLVSAIEKGYQNDTLYHYGIFHVPDKIFIGVIKIGMINKVHNVSDMATLIGNTRYLRRGYATEAILQANKIAFTQHYIRKLSSGMFKNNVGSVKAYVKAGWGIEGILKAHYLSANIAHDKIVVACFNPEIYPESDYHKGQLSVDAIYAS